MLDYSNKKITFLHSGIVVKITNCLCDCENSQIYLCTDLNNNNKEPQKYSLKIVQANINDKQANKNICLEINILLSLKKENNIIHIKDYYNITKNEISTYFILMEYGPNGTLADLISKNSNEKNILSTNVIYAFTYQLAKGLKAIHNNNYCHRDFRPENIVLTSKNNLRIIDFGSATNKKYDVINHNIRANLILEISKNTYQNYRAPEEFLLYHGYPINEKVDIYALGLILYSMMFSSPFINNFDIQLTFASKNVFEQILNDIKNWSNPYFFKLLKAMLSINPSDRPSAQDIIKFLDNHKDNILKYTDNNYINEKISFANNLSKLIYQYMESELSNNSINIKYLTSRLLLNRKDFYPEMKYIKMLICKTFKNNKKICKFYQYVAGNSPFYYSLCGIKAIYLLHSYIFNYGKFSNNCESNIEIINPSLFNLDELLVLISDIYNYRINNQIYDKNENLKNGQIIKFILSYCEFLKAKVGYLRKYTNIIGNDNSVITTDYNKLIEKNFIEDTMCLFIQTFQVILYIPFNSNLIIKTLDRIASALNEEIVTFFSLLYYINLVLKNLNYEQSNSLREFCKISLKANDFIEKLKKYRIDISSELETFFFGNENQLNDALSYLQSSLPSQNNNIKKLFSIVNKELFGIKLKMKNSFTLNNISVNSNSSISSIEFDSNNINFNQNFNFQNNNNKENLSDINDNSLNENNIKSNNNSQNNDINNNNYVQYKEDIFTSVNSNFEKSSDNSNGSFNNMMKCAMGSYYNNNNNTQISNSHNYSNTRQTSHINFSNMNNTFKNQSNDNIFTNNSKFNNTNILNYQNSFMYNNTNTTNIYSNQNMINMSQFYNNCHQNNNNINNLNNQNNEIINNQYIFNQNNQNKEYNLNQNQIPQSINIVNIVQNYTNNSNNNNNNININNEEYFSTRANTFLDQQLSLPNFHFILPSSSIKLIRRIGFGGSSEVFLGDYRGTEVALKKLKTISLKEENLKEFKREVSSLSIIRHPNLVLFMGAIAEQDNICIVTEYCDGGTLFSLLHQRKEINIPWELRIRILLEIATGMNFLHTNIPQIIHRDLKSLNILLTNKIVNSNDLTSIKISDFGLSKILSRLDKKEIMTGNCGTCHWMAPEVIKNLNYSIKADVYSFGIIIWECCVRETPYKNLNQQQITYYVTVKKGRPDLNLIPKDCPLGMKELMVKCWNDDENVRPSFGNIINELKKIKEYIDNKK